MSTEFIVSNEHENYTYVGHAQGCFDAEQADGSIGKRNYYSMYVLSPVSSYSSPDYQAYGFKAEKKSCVSADVWKDLVPGDRVKLFFDDKKRVVLTMHAE